MLLPNGSFDLVYNRKILIKVHIIVTLLLGVSTWKMSKIWDHKDTWFIYQDGEILNEVWNSHLEEFLRIAVP